MTTFPRTGRARGYEPRSVDAFLERVEARITAAEAGEAVPLPAREIRRVGFRLVRDGYEPERVDAVLDLLEERALQVELRDGAQVATATLLERVRPVLTGPDGARLARTGWRRPGYRLADVDAVCARLRLPLLEGRGSLPTPGSIRQLAFPVARHGYDEDATDAFLDDVTEILLRAAGGRFR